MDVALQWVGPNNLKLFLSVAVQLLTKVSNYRVSHIVSPRDNSEDRIVHTCIHTRVRASLQMLNQYVSEGEVYSM